ncbi:antigen WC1.1-like isoform X2 [Excalfactoria chinensis]|uniref:antigen WC1.1-like isoform X2 n=1 Tax=Excalfactoria chinensis TaxID=46218 RepID=UPI003B3B89FF
MEPGWVLGLLLCVRLCGPSAGPAAVTRPAPAMGNASVQLRLVGGGHRCAGRVEVKHEGEWGSVCTYDFDWDARGAGVVCRQLGCGAAVRASPYAPFGQGEGRIWLHPFNCRGTELALQDCYSFGWGRHFCGHEWDVGVTCSGEAPPRIWGGGGGCAAAADALRGAEALELRLAAGRGPCEGRVEVKLRGRWGAVADGAWTMEDAEVVCQQLGCGSAAGAYHGSKFGPAEGPISVAVVNCRGNESVLWDCDIRGWGPYDGHHDHDTAVVCQGFSRLVGGDGACQGRLEVRRGRAWLGVCHGRVNAESARVLCRELGCGAVLALPEPGRFGAASGPLWDGAFECGGSEPLLAACAARPAPEQRCTDAAAVVCSPYTGFRLADGGSPCAGRVEAEQRGTWGALCAASWELPDAHVLCRHLGCGPAASVQPGGRFGAGKGPLRRDRLGCAGNERHPGECPAAVLGEPDCVPGRAAAVICSGAAETLRLRGGESRCDGRLELNSSPDVWTGVSAASRDGDDGTAAVACRQLGCGALEKAYAAPGGGSGLSEVRCEGGEELLERCYAAGLSRGPSALAVICSGSRRLRLAGGPGRCAGRVEAYVDGAWSSVCRDAWSLRDAAVVCRQLRCGTALEAPGPERFGSGTGTPWAGNGGCAGTEAALWDCPARGGGCGGGGGAGAVCAALRSLRLEGGGCGGILELLHDGAWGRVCADGTVEDGSAAAAAVCRHLGCGAAGTLHAVPDRSSGPAWLGRLRCEDGSRSIWRCSSTPWSPRSCGPAGVTHVACDEDGSDAAGSPAPGSGRRDGDVRAAVPPGDVPLPTVLCALLGAMLSLALAALAVQAHRARARRAGPGRDAGSEAVYEELDYSQVLECREGLSCAGSLLQGSGLPLSHRTGDEAEGGGAAGMLRADYDDAAAVPEESPGETGYDDVGSPGTPP